ncbi:hypothetical protein Cma02nite_13140 [Cellulomonas marina]|uniref:Uroporphyrinogen-III synthase n=1 Tax=Cellulomonas marina TaxID=988821 RepID=A0A1I0YHN8_9CELL|nr:hypothetical protein Cma02nite_13140 [Cellulomonas marina]SFB12010.1 uroporphyrinogen-III synthase/uroporphyrinogen III methyltransferase / synthase [Cellulomonas marina]
MPLLVTAPPADPRPLDEALAALAAGRYARLAVTSTAAVASLLEAAARSGQALPDVVAAGGARVAAVGPGTARALRDAGVRVDLVPPAAVAAGAAGLLAVWPPAPAGGARVLFPRGDRALPTLPTGLRARGWDVAEVVAYRTVDGPDPAPEVVAAWRDGAVDGVLLTSPSAVDAVLARLGPPPPTTRTACIGATTRDAAERHGLRVDAVADRPTAAALVAALLAVLTTPPPRPHRRTP